MPIITHINAGVDQAVHFLDMSEHRLSAHGHKRGMTDGLTFLISEYDGIDYGINHSIHMYLNVHKLPDKGTSGAIYFVCLFVCCFSLLVGYCLS